MEEHPIIAAEEERASHSLVGYNVHPNCNGHDGQPLWLIWMVILACRWVLSSCRDSKPHHVLGVVDRTQDASAAPEATIWSKAP